MKDKPLKLNASLKRFNLPAFIKRRSNELNLNVKVNVIPVKTNWLQSLFSPEREDIVVDFNSPKASLTNIPELQLKANYCQGVMTLCDITNYMDGIKSQLV